MDKSIEELENIIEELKDEVEEWQGKYRDLEQILEDNYIPRLNSDYTGDSYDDRF